jgi:hypothetical protein
VEAVAAAVGVRPNVAKEEALPTPLQEHLVCESEMFLLRIRIPLTTLKTILHRGRKGQSAK